MKLMVKTGYKSKVTLKNNNRLREFKVSIFKINSMIQMFNKMIQFKMKTNQQIFHFKIKIKKIKRIRKIRKILKFKHKKKIEFKIILNKI